MHSIIRLARYRNRNGPTDFADEAYFSYYHDTISPWTRIHRIPEQCSHLKWAWWLRSPKWVGFIIATSDAQPDLALPIYHVPRNPTLSIGTSSLPSASNVLFISDPLGRNSACLDIPHVTRTRPLRTEIREDGFFRRDNGGFPRRLTGHCRSCFGHGRDTRGLVHGPLHGGHQARRKKPRGCTQFF